MRPSDSAALTVSSDPGAFPEASMSCLLGSQHLCLFDLSQPLQFSLVTENTCRQRGDREAPRPGLGYLQEISLRPGVQPLGETRLPALVCSPCPVPLIKTRGRRPRSPRRLDVSPLGHSCSHREVNQNPGRHGPETSAQSSSPLFLPHWACVESGGQGLLVLAPHPAQRILLPSWGIRDSGGREGLGESLGPTVGPDSRFILWYLTERLLRRGNSHRPRATRRGRLRAKLTLCRNDLCPPSICLSI